LQCGEDSSNASNKYLNKIRHDLVPLLKAESHFYSTFQNTQTYLQEAAING
jgi:hypothetical protein